MFLQPHHLTLPTVQRDYPEWHLGRKKYALWYLEIEDQDLLEYLQQLRTHFSDLLFQPIHRQFHITLYICGFLTDQINPQHNDGFLSAALQAQCTYLKQNPISAFILRSTQIRSFDSALMIEVDDPSRKLFDLRQIFAQYTPEIAALQYCAHITLGVYRDAYDYAQIHHRIAAIKQQQFEFEVKQLTFGWYQPDILQGPLYADRSIALDRTCYNSY